MYNIAIIYFTHSGITRQLAKSIIKGTRESHHSNIIEYQITGEEIVNGRFMNDALFTELHHADAIIFGSPTYMGSVAAQFKAFADASSEVWSQQLWAGKLAAGFTCGTGLNGEQSSTLEYFITLSNQHGMLWVGLDSAYGYSDHGVNRMGCSLGVVAHAPFNKVHDADLATAHYLGVRVTRLLNRFSK